jgi:hypothetical protein
MDPVAPYPQQAPPPVIIIERNDMSDERKQIVSKVIKLGQSDGDRMEFPHGTIKSVATNFMCIQERLGDHGHARNLIITTLR